MPSMFDTVTSKKYKNAKKPKNIKNYFDTLKPINKLKIEKMLQDVY